MIQEIASGVYVQSGSYVQEQRGLVCGKDRCILVDAPRYFDEADELRNAANDMAANGVGMAVITHGHLDHIATLQVFPDIIVVSNWAARNYMERRGQEELEKLSQSDPELHKVHQVLPSVTFAGEGVVFDDSGRSLRCIPAPGHSEDSQIVLLESEKVIFGGDVLSAVVPPYFPDGNSLQLEETITRLANLNADILVPGHGPVLRGDEISSEAGDAVRYLENLRRLVREGVEQGRDAETLQEQIKWEDCSVKPAPPEEYLQYHRENIANMTKEISEELTAMKASPAWRV